MNLYMHMFVASTVALCVIGDNPYNLIWSDDGTNGRYFWGLNLDLSITNNDQNCCNGTIIRFNSNYEERVNYYTNNGSHLIAQMLTSDGGKYSRPGILTIHNDQESVPLNESMYFSPPSPTIYNTWEFIALSYTKYEHENTEHECTLENANAIGLWTNLYPCPSKINYGCINTLNNQQQIIKTWFANASIDSDVAGGYMANGAIYDSKRDLLWSYNHAWNYDVRVVSIHSNGTDFKQFLVPSPEQDTPINCHYSEYYDIYSCLCNDFDYCYFNPNTGKLNYIENIMHYPGISSFALIDNGKNAILINIDLTVWVMDVLNANNLRQIGNLRLPQYNTHDYQSIAGPFAILISFTG